MNNLLQALSEFSHTVTDFILSSLEQMKEDFEIAAGIEQDFNPYAKNYDKKNPKESLKFQLKIIGKFNKIYDEDSVVDLDLDVIKKN